MRKIFSVVILLCALMFLTFDSATAARRKSANYPAEGVVVNIAENDRLNIREKPSAKSRILDALDNGTYVVVNGEADSPNGSKWYYIYHEESGVSGYVSAKYISLEGRTQSTPKRTEYPVEGVVINIPANDRLNIRSAPNIKSRILDALDNGARVTVNGEAKSAGGSKWYYIYYEESDVSGYVASKYIELQ